MADFFFGSRGLVDSLRGTVETALRILEARLELVGIELQEEKSRILGLAVLAAGTVVFLALALVVLTIGVIAFFWEDPGTRHLAIWVVFGVYVVLALACWALFARRVRRQTKIFETTIEEIRKDRQWLRPH